MSKDEIEVDFESDDTGEDTEGGTGEDTEDDNISEVPTETSLDSFTEEELDEIEELESQLTDTEELDDSEEETEEDEDELKDEDIETNNADDTEEMDDNIEDANDTNDTNDTNETNELNETEDNIDIFEELYKDQPRREKRRKIEQKYCKESKKGEERENDIYMNISVSKLKEKYKTILTRLFTFGSSKWKISAENITSISSRIYNIALEFERKENRVPKDCKTFRITFHNTFTFIYGSILWSLTQIPQINNKGSNISSDSFKLNNIFFESDLYKDSSERDNQNISLIITPPVVEDGEHTCKKCGCKKTINWKLQTRSSDEPMTTFIQCIKCRNKWKIS